MTPKKIQVSDTKNANLTIQKKYNFLIGYLEVVDTESSFIVSNFPLSPLLSEKKCHGH